MTEAINMMKQAGNHDTATLEGFPLEGMGKRAMGCKMYDRCLYKAAVKDWYSFNCDGCGYEGQGALEFIDSAFMPEFKEPDITFEEDLEMELVELVFNLPSLNFTGEVLNNGHAA